MGFNSPLPVRLEDESRKAAKILRSFVDVNNNGLDKVIPRNILERAAGFAIFTVFKAGFVVSARAGSGIVIARLDDGSWSPPSAIGLGGFGFGGQAGAEVTDFIIVLNSHAAVASFMSAGNLTLGGNLSLAVGPLGRNAEGSGAVNTKGRLAAMYSYSKTKGLFGGVSVEGSVIVERQDANRIAYGGNPSAKQILSGTFDPPEWCHVLIDQLDKSTGLPGGQRWRDRDEEGEGGGMGLNTSTPERKGGGYVFGAGVGAGGSTPPTDRRGGGGGERKRAGSLFGSSSVHGAGSGSGDRQLPPGSPSRPGNNRKGSSFNPFSNVGSSSPRKSTLENSSENYTAGLTWDAAGPMGLGIGNVAGQSASSAAAGNRSRSGSLLRNGEVPAPFSYMGGKSTPDRNSRIQSQTHSQSQSQSSMYNPKDKDLIGDWDQPRSSSRDPFSSLVPGKSSEGIMGPPPPKPSGSENGVERDLLGTWDSDGRGLSASFGKLSTNSDLNANGDRNRSRSNSRPTPFESIQEDRQRYESRVGDQEYDYTPRETTSAFAAMNWSNAPPISGGSSSAAMGQTSSSGSGGGAGRRGSPTKLGKKTRPFSSYIPSTSPSLPNNNSFSPSSGGNGYNKEFSPFEDLPVGRLRSDSGSRERPFEDYMHLSQPSGNTMDVGRRSSGPKPDLKLKAGLERSSSASTSSSAYEGYGRAVALFDFQATSPGDLGLKAGQVVIVLGKVGEKGDWWKGVLADSRHSGGGGGSGGGGREGGEGIFPASYVEVVELPKNPKGLGWGELRKRVAGNEFD